MKKVLFLTLFAALLLLSACGTEESAVQTVPGVEPPRLCVTAGETVVHESKGINSWRSGSLWLSGEPVSLEYRAEHMEYDTVSQAQAKYSFTLTPNGIGIRCFQYIDGKLIPGETTLSETDGTLELLPGKWIYQITANWHSEADDYVGSGTFTFGIDVQ